MHQASLSFCCSREHGNPGRSAFTLIELLIVIAIIAILSIVVVLTLSPGEMLRQSRDATRLSDMDTMNRALGFYVADTAIQGTSLALGNASTVYISLVDSSSSCGSWGLPALPAGYVYHCSSATSSRNTDGSGWIPVPLKNISSGSPLGSLPVDPRNQSSTGLYYTYVTNGSQYEIATLLESDKNQSVAVNDGDSYPGVYSLRTSGQSLTPGTRDKGLVGYWKFDEGTGTTTYDSSGNNRNGILSCADNGGGACAGGANLPIWNPNGEVSGSLEFTQNNPTSANYVSVPTSDLCTFTNIDCGSRTVLFWAKLKAATNNVFMGTIYSNCVSGLSKGWLIQLSGSKVIFSWVPNSYTAQCNAYATFLSNSSLTTNVWYHVAVVMSASNFKIYLNGNLDANLDNTVGVGGANTGGYAPQPNLFINGSYYPYYNAMNTYLDDVRVYNRALSASEIQAIYNAEK